MVTFFSIYSTVCLPPAFVMLILLTVPLPNFIERAVRPFAIRLSSFVFFHPISVLQGRTLFELLFSVSIFVLATTTRAWQAASARHDANKDSSNRQYTLMMKWRKERNFWICVCGITLYWCLYRFTLLAARCEELVADRKQPTAKERKKEQ